MIKVHVAADGTKSFQVYGRARIRDKSLRVYVGSFASQKQAEAADEQHRVTQRAIKAGDLPAAVDHKRTLGDALDAWLRAIMDQRSHDEYESRMRLYVRPTFDGTPLVKITKPKLIDLRSSLKEREEPIGNATINTLFASLSAAYSYFIEQGWCSENPLKFIRDLEVTERPFLWLQSAGEVQKLLSACNDNIRTLVAVLVGTGMRLDEALHLMWTDVDLQHRVIHVHRGRRGAPKSGRLRHVPIFDSVLTVLRDMKLAKGKNTLLWPDAKLDKFDEQLPQRAQPLGVIASSRIRARTQWERGKLGAGGLMAQRRRKRSRPVRKPTPPPMTTPPDLTDTEIDAYFATAAQTIKAVEQQLQSTLRLPASSLLLRIQTRR
jgi:integrase